MSAPTFNFQSAPMDTDGRNGSWLTDWHKMTKCNWGSPAVPSFRNDCWGIPVFSSSYDCRPVSNKFAESVVNNGLGWTFQSQFTQPTVEGGTNVKFRPVMVDEVAANNVKVQFQSITSMPEYQNKSLEELRLEDYIIGRGSPHQRLNQRPEHYNEPSLLDLLLQNVVSGPVQNANTIEDMAARRDFADAEFYGKTPLLLQALLNNIKQRFSLSDLSEETRRRCEKLTQKLMEFTEKTLENIAVVVLEDMLNTIKQRKNSSSAVTTTECAKPEKSACCKSSDSKKSYKKKGKSNKEKLSSGHHKKTKKVVNDYSSEYDDDSSCGGASDEGEEHHCSSTRGDKTMKKTPDDHHDGKSYGGRDRRHSPHLILRYKKRGKRCDGGSHKCCTRAEDVCLNRSDGIYELKKNVSSKVREHNAISRKKKQHAARNRDNEAKDECYICEHFKMISVNESGRECATTSTSTGKKEKNICSKESIEEDDYDLCEEERDGDENDLSEHSVDKNVNEIDCANEKSLSRLEEKLESDNPDADFSDSESI